MIREHYMKGAARIRILFVADGPGLAHGDTWQEAVRFGRNVGRQCPRFDVETRRGKGY